MRRELLQAILDDRQIMDKTDFGYIEVTNEFALRILANGGGQFLTVKPIPKPNMRFFVKLQFINNKLNFEYEQKSQANVAVVMDGNTFEVLAVHMRNTPEFNAK